MLHILLAQERILCRYLLVNAERVILDADAAICLWCIEVIALVLEYCCLTQYGKTMSKALWYEELDMIIFSQLYSHMFAVGWTSLTNVNGHI